MFKRALILATLVVFALPLSARAEMSEQDRLARCANNQERIDALQTELKTNPDLLSDEAIARMRLDLEVAWRRATDPDSYAKWVELAIRYGFIVGKDCYPDDCSAKIAQEINNRYEKAAAARPRYLQIQTELAQHRGHMEDLHCSASSSQTLTTTQEPSSPQQSSKEPSSAQGEGSFSLELSVNGNRCTATPGKDCLKEFDMKRPPQGAPTLPLTVVAKQYGFPTDNYSVVIACRGQTKECEGETTCNWALPGLDVTPLWDECSASLKCLGKKDRQRDNGGSGQLVDGLAARVNMHYP